MSCTMAQRQQIMSKHRGMSSESTDVAGILERNPQWMEWNRKYSDSLKDGCLRLEVKMYGRRKRMTELPTPLIRSRSSRTIEKQRNESCTMTAMTYRLHQSASQCNWQLSWIRKRLFSLPYRRNGRTTGCFLVVVVIMFAFVFPPVR